MLYLNIVLMISYLILTQKPDVLYKEDFNWENNDIEDRKLHNSKISYTRI